MEARQPRWAWAATRRPAYASCKISITAVLIGRQPTPAAAQLAPAPPPLPLPFTCFEYGDLFPFLREPLYPTLCSPPRLHLPYKLHPLQLAPPSHAEVDALLAPALAHRLLSIPSDFFTYEFLYKNHTRQFHRTTGGSVTGEDPIGSRCC